MAFSPITLQQIEGWKRGSSDRFSFLDSNITVDSNTSHEKQKCLLLRRKFVTKRHHISDIDQDSQSYGFSSGSVRCESWTIWRLSAKELMLLNYGAGEDSWGPLDCKQIKQVNPIGNQPHIFVGRTDAKTEALTICNATTNSLEKIWHWERLKARGKGGGKWWDG